MRDIQIYSQNEAQTHFTWYTQRFLRGWWRTEEGEYINKEQGWGCSPSLHLHTWSMPWRCSRTFIALTHMVDVHVRCTCRHGRCYATFSCWWGLSRILHLHTCSVLGTLWGWTGVGWGGHVTVSCTCTHMLNATQQVGWGPEFRGDAVGVSRPKCFGKTESGKKELPENLWKRDGFQDVLC